MEIMMVTYSREVRLLRSWLLNVFRLNIVSLRIEQGNSHFSPPRTSSSLRSCWMVLGRMLIGKESEKKDFQATSQSTLGNHQSKVAQVQGTLPSPVHPTASLRHLCKFKLPKRVKWLCEGRTTIELFSHLCYLMHPSNDDLLDILHKKQSIASIVDEDHCSSTSML
ncbi:hypothetical protein H5410_058637, partial [Solanum commersonii]